MSEKDAGREGVALCRLPWTHPDGCACWETDRDHANALWGLINVTEIMIESGLPAQAWIFPDTMAALKRAADLLENGPTPEQPKSLSKRSLK
jgi:hypothetical protein